MYFTAYEICLKFQRCFKLLTLYLIYIKSVKIYCTRSSAAFTAGSRNLKPMQAAIIKEEIPVYFLSKYYRLVGIIAGKRGGCGAKINALIDGQVCCRIDVILFKNKFKYHLRHTAFSSPKYISSFYILPCEII